MTATEIQLVTEERTEVSRDEIARVAHLLWEARGGGGSPEEDWFNAEEILRNLA
jgi:hypothetical protein